MDRVFKDDISIVLAGEAGQGIQSIESFLTRFLKRSRVHVFSTSEFMSRIRGGVNSTQIRISSKKKPAPLDRIDILIALNSDSVSHLGRRVTRKTVVIGERDIVSFEGLLDVPFKKMALESGGELFANSVAAGLVCGFIRTDKKALAAAIAESFSGKSQEIQDKNKVAALKGYDHAVQKLGGIRIDIARDEKIGCEMTMNGSDAVAFGALAGGCDYVCAYPMSPSTGVLVNMAKYSAVKDIDLVVEQVEDEVGVVNMAQGAWYAGARALVTTSGGGFALMSEGISLAGMIESPLVVHLAQRPGPATGLPTRTEQGDLNLALYAGHGDFPRVIYTPGTLEEAFQLTQKAFHMADRYQSPVFVLTDQYLVDSSYSVPCLSTEDMTIEKEFVKTGRDYKRYQLAKNGLSPRGVPGFGEGLVKVDSDEHDESGYITEDPDLRVKMVDKRLSKIKLIKKETVKPTLTGPKKFSNLLVGWGSTFHIIKEAMENIGDKKTAFMHFSQVYPLHEKAGDILKSARRVILVENNAAGQFGELLKKEFGVEIGHKILKYSGSQFTVEELTKKISAILKKKG